VLTPVVNSKGSLIIGYVSKLSYYRLLWARGSVVGRGTMHTSSKDAGSIHDEIIGFIVLPNPSRRNMALGSTQSLTEMSTRRKLFFKRLILNSLLYMYRVITKD
jgi:hypothetical protein